LIRIGDLYEQGRPIFSFEFFPPKTDEAVEGLLRTVRELKEVGRPDFISVTYGAGGGTRSRTLACVSRIQTELGIPAMAHLACMGHTRAEIGEIVERLVQSGIRNVLALRGDPPRDGACSPVDGLANATDLIDYVRGHFDVDVGGACYPETHPEAVSADRDLQFAVRKAELGARFLITQLFFDNEDYFRFVERARRSGIGVPIVPGIMPITNVAQVERFTKLCGARIPSDLHARLERHREDPGAVMAIGIEHAVTQCRNLLREHAPGLHFYTLNKSLATRVILAAIRALE